MQVTPRHNLGPSYVNPNYGIPPSLTYRSAVPVGPGSYVHTAPPPQPPPQAQPTITPYGVPYSATILGKGNSVVPGPVYALASSENLPAPVESKDQVECISGDPNDPFSPRTYRVVTTHVLPAVVVKQPVPVIAEEPVQREIEPEPTPPPPPPPPPPVIRGPMGEIGELYMDPADPKSLAPWLLLLEANAPFVTHEVEPHIPSHQSMANPYGSIPSWIDADGSYLWESNAIMKFVCVKHNLPHHLYPVDDLNLLTRTNIALDWCISSLAVHIDHVVRPEVHEHGDLSDIPGGRMCLEDDLLILTDWFLRETPFIGGIKPNVADIAIATNLLQLYGTDFLPPSKVREYLHNTAENCRHWNEVTSEIREICRRKQLERNKGRVRIEDRRAEHERRQRQDDIEYRRREREEQWRREEEEWSRALHEEARIREEDDLKRFMEADLRRREEWEVKEKLDDEIRKKDDDDWSGQRDELVKQIDEVVAIRSQEEAKWREYMAKLQAEEDEKARKRKSDRELDDYKWKRSLETSMAMSNMPSGMSTPPLE